MEQLTIEEINDNSIREDVSEKPWSQYFGDLDYDPCSSIKRPENISDDIFYKACYMASHYEAWFDEPDKMQLDAAWNAISSLNATVSKGERLFDEA